MIVSKYFKSWGKNTLFLLKMLHGLTYGYYFSCGSHSKPGR